MKKLTIIAALVALVASPALADWDHAVKWDQLDPASTWGAMSMIDYDGERAPMVADDWRCNETEWVTDVHFNGWSQFGAQWVVGVRVTIWDDVPAGPSDESHPGLLRTTFDVGPDVTPGPSEGFHYDDVEDLWSVNFPVDDWFWQEYGNVYWISVQPIMFDDGYPEYFAWNFVDYPVHNEDDAVLWDDETLTWRHWGWFWADDGAGGLVLEPDLYDGVAPPIGVELGDYAGSADMSFSLTGVPEPSTLALLTIGGLALIRRR